MKYSADFFRSVIDSVPDHMAIIDGQGRIEYVNASWVAFSCNNDGVKSSLSDWQGTDYLRACDVSARAGDPDAGVVVEATRQILADGDGEFYYEYACHSPTEQRWFMMRVAPLQWPGKPTFLVAHQNITERKLAELAVEAMSRIDGLTQIANRRHFDEFLQQEWRRSARQGSPLSLILLDIDHFKDFNDWYGHQAGDDCLRQVGGVLTRFARRAGDLAARYGGEEFALVLADTDQDEASRIGKRLLRDLRGMGIPHERSPSGDVVTASAGVVAHVARPRQEEHMLLRAADRALYDAKVAGRNQMVLGRLQD